MLSLSFQGGLGPPWLVDGGTHGGVSVELHRGLFFKISMQLLLLHAYSATTNCAFASPMFIYCAAAEVERERERKRERERLKSIFAQDSLGEIVLVSVVKLEV